MNNLILNEIQELMKSSGNCSTATIDYLYRQKCLYLLSRVKNDFNKHSYHLITNEIVQKKRYTYCKSFFDRLTNIPYAIIKGAVLSNSIYGKSFYRLSDDIDILISPNNIQRITKILKSEGFIQGSVVDEQIQARGRDEILFYKLYTHQLASFQKRTDDILCPYITIDINYSMLWGESTHKINLNHLLDHSENTSIYGIKVKKLPAVFEFISMCLHHYKDMNSIYLLHKRGFNLCEFLDIYYYLTNQEIDLYQLNEITHCYNITQFIYYCIYYTNELFNDKKLKKYLDVLKTDEGVELLNCFGLNKDEKHIWNIPFLNRIFDENFRQEFEKQLTENDLKKIEINSKFIMSKTI